MRIYIGADHNGFQLKAELANYLRLGGYEVIDEGDARLNSDDDFPEFAARVVTAMLGDEDRDTRGILICGSGQGMAMAANRFKGIRAGVVWDAEEARLVRNDDDSNVLCLSARVLKNEKANSVVHVWLSTPFAAAPRFVRRIHQMDKLG